MGNSPDDGVPPPARAAGIPPLARVVLALIVGVAVFIALAFLLERYLGTSPTFAAFASALVVDFVVAILLGILTLVVTALFGHKLPSLTEMIGKTRCPHCDNGLVTCADCGGTGNKASEVDVQVDCPSCHGAGRTLEVCPHCRGAKRIERQARFERIGPEVTARMDWNLLHFGHWEEVTVGVSNKEDQLAQFGLIVAVAGASSDPVQRDTLSLPGGLSATRTFSFKIHGGTPFASSFEVSPGNVVVTCPTCLGSGNVQSPCANCASTGKVGDRKTVTGPCTACSGKGRVSCTSCKGTGKVYRVP